MINRYLEHKRGLQTKLTEIGTVGRARRRKTLHYVTGDAYAHCPAWCLDLGVLLVGGVEIFPQATVSSKRHVLASQHVVLRFVLFVGERFHRRNGEITVVINTN